MEHKQSPDLRAERVNYTLGQLDEAQAGTDPHALFDQWMSEAIERRNTEGDVLEPNAMVLSTINPETEWPDSRVLLLKEHANGKFVFFGNYESRKGQDLDANGKAALNFTWLPMQRQIRIQGTVRRISPEASDTYFAVRPRGSQLGAWASSQSSVIESSKELDRAYDEAEKRFEGQDVPRPPHWGGWEVTPHRIEFWQGRPSRTHDRIVFIAKDAEEGAWTVQRLAP